MPRATQTVFAAAVLIAPGLAVAPTAHGAVTLLSSFAPVSLDNGGNEPAGDGVFNLTALGTSSLVGDISVTDTVKVFVGGYNVPSSAPQVSASGATVDLLNDKSFTADGNGAGYFTQKFALLLISSGGNLKLSDVTLASKPTP